MKSRLVIAPALLATLTLVACGSDSGSTQGDTSTPTVASSLSTAEQTTAPAASDTETTTLTGEEICTRLTVESVAADTGLKMGLASADDSSTPQCAYDYSNDTGGTSNLTVAAMRPDDVGGRTGKAAFDYVVRINESIAGPDAERQEVSAGDAAIRLTGNSLHTGVLQVGDAVFTVIVPVDEVGPDGVDRLIATMATTLG